MSKLAANAELAGVVAAKLDDDWSPQQIAQWLRREYPRDAAMRVSHESIYRDVYMPSRNVFDASMFHRLRSDRPIRRPRGKRSSYGRGQIRNTVSIRQIAPSCSSISAGPRRCPDARHPGMATHAVLKQTTYEALKTSYRYHQL